MLPGPGTYLSCTTPFWIWIWNLEDRFFGFFSDATADPSCGPQPSPSCRSGSSNSLLHRELLPSTGTVRCIRRALPVKSTLSTLQAAPYPPHHPGLVLHRSLPLPLLSRGKRHRGFHPQDRAVSEPASLPRALCCACISRRLLCASQRINTSEVGQTFVAGDTDTSTLPKMAHQRKWPHVLASAVHSLVDAVFC